MFQDLRYGVRMLLKNPGFHLDGRDDSRSRASARTPAIFTVVNAVLLRPLPYPASKKLMEVGRAFIGSDLASDLSVSEPKFVFLRDQAQSFEAVTATQGLGSNVYLSDESQIEYIRGLIVSAEFFRVLGRATGQRTRLYERGRQPRRRARGDFGRRIVAAALWGRRRNYQQANHAQRSGLHRRRDYATPVLNTPGRRMSSCRCASIPRVKTKGRTGRSSGD